jgi:hypothetical protein
MAYSKAKLKSSDDKVSPCFRPFWIQSALLNFLLLKYLFVTVIPKYFTYATFLKDVLPLFML